MRVFVLLLLVTLAFADDDLAFLTEGLEVDNTALTAQSENDVSLAGVESMMGLSDLELELGSDLMLEGIDQDVFVDDQSHRSINVVDENGERDRSNADQVQRSTSRAVRAEMKSERKDLSKADDAMLIASEQEGKPERSTSRNAGRRTSSTAAKEASKVNDLTRRDERRDVAADQRDVTLERRADSRDAAALASLRHKEQREDDRSLVRRAGDADLSAERRDDNAARRDEERSMWSQVGREDDSVEKSLLGVIRRDDSEKAEEKSVDKTKATQRGEFADDEMGSMASSLINSLRRDSDVSGEEARFLAREKATEEKDNDMENERTKLKSQESKLAKTVKEEDKMQSKVKQLAKQERAEASAVKKDAKKEESAVKTVLRGHPMQKAEAKAVSSDNKLMRRDLRAEENQEKISDMTKDIRKDTSHVDSMDRKQASKIRKTEEKSKGLDVSKMEHEMRKSARDVGKAERRQEQRVDSDVTKQDDEKREQQRVDSIKNEQKKIVNAAERTSRRVERQQAKDNRATERTMKVMERRQRDRGPNLDAKKGEQQLRQDVRDYVATADGDVQEADDVTSEANQQAALKAAA